MTILVERHNHFNISGDNLWVDHLIFDGGVQIPKKISSTCFWLKKKKKKKKYICIYIYIYLAEFLRRKKISGSLNQGVAKDFASCVTAPKVAVSRMIRDWA